LTRLIKDFQEAQKINIIMVCVALEEWSTDFGAVEFLKNGVV
jgi:hypothetical protein